MRHRYLLVLLLCAVRANAQMDGDSAGTREGWKLATHGSAFVFYDDQRSSRGSAAFASVNWLMTEARHPFASGVIRIRGMFSGDVLTVPSAGYPLLLQTGEVYGGQPIHDRQHPHDLFMEISATYSRTLSSGAVFSIYLAPVGEPSSGPPAYMHRASAESNPLAPIGHHWQDATHISFGVATVSLATRRAMLEASAFNGGEPDQVRTNFDYSGRHLDSFSARLTVNPSDHLSVLGSYAFLRNPEPVFAQTQSGALVMVSRDLRAPLMSSAPREHLIVELNADPKSLPATDVRRLVIATSYTRHFPSVGNWSSTGILSSQRHAYDSRQSLSALFEQTLALHGGLSVFTRAELVQKTAGDLAAPPPRFARELIRLGASPLSFLSRRKNLGEITLGGERAMLRGRFGQAGIGLLGTVNLIPAELQEVYSSRHPVGVVAYLHLRYGIVTHEAMAGM